MAVENGKIEIEQPFVQSNTLRGTDFYRNPVGGPGTGAHWEIIHFQFSFFSSLSLS